MHDVTIRRLVPSDAAPYRTLMLEAGHFRRIVRENGDIGLAVIQVLSERLRVATERESALRLLAKRFLKVDVALP